MRRVLELYRQSFTGLPRDAWVLAAVSLVNRSGTMVLPFLALYLTKERGFSAPEAGWVQGVYGLGSLVGAWIGGILTDRVGARRVQIASLAANGIGFLALGAMRSRPAIFATAAIVSVASEAFRPANAAALAASSPPHLMSRVFALNRMAVNMGMTLGSVIGGVLAVRGYVWLFVVDALTCLVAAVLLSTRPAPARVPAHAVKAVGASPWQDKPFLASWVFIVLLAVIFFQLHSTFMLYLQKVYGFREDLIGALLGINTVLVVALEVVVVTRFEKKAPLRMAAFGALLVGLGFALMPYGRGALWAAASIVIWTAGEIVSFAFLSTFVAGRAGPANQGRYMALYVMAFGLAFVIAPLAGTWVWEHVGPDWVWHGCGILGVVLLAGFGGVSRRVGGGVVGQFDRSKQPGPTATRQQSS
jgi:predicted MFS family arabinose efflux permease